MIKGTDVTQARCQAVVRNAEQFSNETSAAGDAVVAVGVWMDLLGFRSHLDSVNWELTREETRLGLRRIAVLHEVALQYMDDRYEIVHLNDALVMGRDLVARREAVEVTEFLACVDACFETAVLSDSTVGGCGVRGVVAVGKRYGLRGNLGWTSANAQARRPAFFCPRPIMMNTAVGRAYGVESSHELVRQSALYVESSLIMNYGATIMETWDLNATVSVGNLGTFAMVRS